MLEGRERGRGRERVRARVRARVREDAECLTVLPDAMHTCIPVCDLPLPACDSLAESHCACGVQDSASTPPADVPPTEETRGAFSRGPIPRIHLHSVSTY